MRVAMVAPFALAPKSTTRWRVLPLARALAAAGHQVRIVVPPYGWPAAAGLRVVDGGVELVHVGRPARWDQWRFGELAPQLALRVLEWHPDVVHVFKPVGFSGLTGMLLASARPTLPLVIDLDDWERGWHARQGYPRALQGLLRWQEDWLLQRIETVTAASRWLVDWADVARRRYGGAIYLPNGVEASAIGHGPAATRANPRVLLYTRFVEHTPLSVATIWRLVLAQVPAALLMVAGQGLEGQEKELAALARAWRLEDSLRWLGWVPELARPGVFAAADAAMLPVEDTLLNRAKCPMRLADLLAHGVPVAAHAVGDYAGYIRQQETGLLAPAGDDMALADATAQLLQQPELRARLGATAAAAMRSDYCWSSLAREALGAYERASAGQIGTGWRRRMADV